jgi:hypothetical protein
MRGDVYNKKKTVNQATLPLVSMLFIISVIIFLQTANESTSRTLLKVLMLGMANSYWMPVLSPLVTMVSVRKVRLLFFGCLTHFLYNIININNNTRKHEFLFSTDWRYWSCSISILPPNHSSLRPW